MRALALLLLAALPVADGTASVSVLDAPALSFEDGEAYAMDLGGFGVLALATAPLADGRWAIPDDSAFVYVELRVYAGIAEGEVPLGSGSSLTIQRWEAGGEAAPDAPAYLDPTGTLRLTSVSDSLVVGAIDATLTRLAPATGEETEATLTASFRAVPGQIPPP